MLSLMGEVLKLIWWAVIGLFRSRASLEAEIVALRHQLNVLRRKSPKRLSLSEIKSEHSDDVIRRELVSGECARRLEQPAAAAHPCSEINVSARHCNSACKKGALGAGAARQRRRHGQDIPAGSSRSAVPYGHSAMAIGVRLAGRECP
jgi:hypothetical protein